ncbi:hypothetical protein APHAL10511_003013 [Amanita phalloides]|nr:hypothetical protein APHAL10511_003013 [Amanita phalloides]
MSAATLQLGVPLDNTMGAMLVGVLVSAVLHGITLVQTYYYFSLYSKDPWYLKALVVTLVVLDAAHLTFISHMIYHYLITHYYDHSALQRVVWSIVMEALCTGINGGLVQTFYAVRAWKLGNKNWVILAILMMLVIGQVGCGLAWVVIAINTETYEQLLLYNPLTISINAISTAADVLIAGTLTILLHRARTGFRRSDTMINRLILFVVNTGVLTSLCALASLISLIVSPKTLIYAAFYYCLGRLYTNSLIATLNARKGVVQAMDERNDKFYTFQTMTGSTAYKSTATPTPTNNISIRIDTTQEARIEIADEKTMAIGQAELDVAEDSSEVETIATPKARML